MTRKNFIKIIKIRSFWRINKRMGNYSLPNGEKLASYINRLITEQMELDGLGIGEDGEMFHCWKKPADIFWTYEPMTNDGNNNISVSYDEMEKRINRMVAEIVYGA